MNCPYCGSEMTLGYIQCRDGINWTPKKQLIIPLSCLGKGRINLSNGEAHHTAFAYNCMSCKKVILDYSDA